MGTFIVFTDRRFDSIVDKYENDPFFNNYGLIFDIHPIDNSDESKYCSIEGFEKHLSHRYSNIIIMIKDTKFHTNICNKFPVIVLNSINDVEELIVKIKELTYKNLLGKIVKDKEYIEKILTPGESLWQ